MNTLIESGLLGENNKVCYIGNNQGKTQDFSIEVGGGGGGGGCYCNIFCRPSGLKNFLLD